MQVPSCHSYITSVGPDGYEEQEMPRYDCFESTFSIIMLSLELKDGKKRKLLPGGYPYSFNIQQAHTSLTQLNYRLNYGPHFSDICISMPKDAIKPLIQRYLDAHLLHSPDERGLVTLGNNTLLQPTAKGIAIIEKFCINFNVQHTYRQTLFKSELNTMELLHIYHEYEEGYLECSESMLMVLWNRVLGLIPHPYTDKSKRDGSPYWHQWLLHPHGNSLSQYYTSDGIRLFKDVTFQTLDTKEEYQVDYVLSGRGIYQWLMDCTNIMNPKIAQRIAKMFVSREYLRRMDDTLRDEITAADNFSTEISRTVLYRIAHRGHLMCNWCNELELDADVIPAPHWEIITSCDLKPVEKLEDIFADPGLKMIFAHTLQRLHAMESLDFLFDIQEFEIRYNSIPLDDPNSRGCIMSSWQHLASIIYRYISSGSVKEVNISSHLRNSILAEIPDGRIPYSKMQSRIQAVHGHLKAAENHVRDLLSAMIPEFKKDPLLDRLPLIAKAINSSPKLAHVPYQNCGFGPAPVSVI